MKQRRQAHTSRSVVVKGGSVSGVMARVRDLGTQRSDLKISVIGHGSVQIVAATRGFSSRGGGVLTLQAMEEPHQVVVTLVGGLPDSTMDDVVRAISGGQSAASRDTSVRSFQPESPAPTGRFVPPSDWFVGPGTTQTPGESVATTVPPQIERRPVEAVHASDSGGLDQRTELRGQRGPSPSRSIVLRFSNGDVIDVDEGGLLIGREPTRRSSDIDTLRLHPLADPAVSKSHVVIGGTNDGLWIEDRDSTNGTSVIDATGALIEAPAATRVALALPVQILLGDTTIRADWSDR